MGSKKRKPKIELPRKFDNWVSEVPSDPNASVLKQKKQALIHDCDAGDGVHVEYTEAGTVVFDHGTAVLPDDTRADDIMAELKSRKTNHRDRYAYIRHRESMRRDPIHNYTFGTIELPWAKYDEFGKRINDD